MSLFIRAVFALGACALMAVAAILMVYAPYVAFLQGLDGNDSLREGLFGTVGYLIVAIALFDVAKYFFEEEVPAARQKRTSADTRRGLTKFISTIIIAIFLEALVMIFETAREDTTLLIYPALLVAAGCLTMVSLGVFQRLSAAVEREVGSDLPAEDKAP